MRITATHKRFFALTRLIGIGGVVMVLIWALLIGGVYAVATHWGVAVMRDARLAEASGVEACALPCWAGIIPGESSPDDSLAIAQNNLTLQSWRYNDNPPVLRLAFGESALTYQEAVIEFREERVHRMYLALNVPALVVWRAWGAPTCARPIGITMNDGWQALVVVWEREAYSARSVLLRQANMPLDTMRLQDIQITADDNCTVLRGEAWRGFAPDWWYRQNHP